MSLTETQGDAFSAVVFAAFAGYLYAQTTAMPAQAARYPFLLEGVFGITALALLLRAAARLARGLRGTRLLSNVAWAQVGLVIAVWILGIFALSILGFYVTVAVMVGVIAWILDDTGSVVRRLVRISLFGIAVAFTFWLIFGRALGVATPTGWFF